MKAPPELKAIRILEITWLVIGIASCVIGFYELFISQTNSGFAFFIFAGVASIMFILRRQLRKRMEKD